MEFKLLVESGKLTQLGREEGNGPPLFFSIDVS